MNILVLVFFIVIIVCLVKFQNYPERVFGSMLAVLYATNFVSTEQVVSSFSNQGLLTLIMLICCSFALEKTKLLRVITASVISCNYSKTWVRLFGLTALTSAVLNNTAVVSIMLSPIRNNTYHPASKLLIPLSYAAILGGTLTLVGTSTNLIVNSLVLDTGLPSLNFFDFTMVGSCAVVACGVVLYFCSRYLPSYHQSSVESSDYFIEAKVECTSSLVGKSIEQNGLRHLESLFLVEVLRNGHLMSPVSPSEVIQKNDRLVFCGDIKKVTMLNQFNGLTLFADKNGLPLDNLTEVVLKPESVLVGQSIRNSGFRALFDAAVVAIKRDGQPLSGKLGNIVLKAGDFLILTVGDDFKSRHNINKNFFVLSGVETDSTLQGWRGIVTIVGFFCTIILAAFNIVPLFKGMFLLLCLLLLSGCLKSNELLQRLPTGIWLIIASALSLSQALTSHNVLSGLNALIQSYQSVFTPLVGLVVVYCLTWLLTELVTNNAAAALVFPIAFELSTSLGVEPMPFILAVAFGASASFISPYGYQTNLMVYTAGQYRIKDFVRIGVPMCLTYGVVVISSIYWLIGF